MGIQFTCPFCHRTMNVASKYAGQTGPCGQTITIPLGEPTSPFGPATSHNDLGNDATMRMLLPVGRSLWAVAAGYFGLFSLLVFPAPIAVLLGIVAIVDIRRHPNRHGMGRAIFGLVMGVVFSGLLVFALIASVFQ